MNRISLSILATMLLLHCTSTFGQERVDPNKVYKSGEKINAPLFGISLDIPEGWVGYLAREAQIFVLNKANNEGTEVFTFARENTLDQIKMNLRKGLNLSPSIQLKVDTNIEETDGMLSAPVSFTGTTGGQRKAHVYAKCGDYGVCATLLLASLRSSLEQNKDDIKALIESMVFEAPTPIEKLEPGIDWSGFLEAKYLYSKASTGGQKSVIQIWLNRDHSFSSKAMPQEWSTTPSKKYAGKQKGNWTVTRRNNTDFLVLNYNKLDQILVSLSVDVDGENYFLNETGFFIIDQ
ncbi:MAG: hypothetical protein AAGC47_15940 [Bacteroidota bacterium]